jgi:low affinity Fe/Cu permease
MKLWFSNAARAVERWVGSSTAFIAAVAVVLVWAATGPFFNYSDTWQLCINTGTTIVTFLMCFAIQNSQTSSTEALQVKLDELIRVDREARNELVNLEDKTQEEIDEAKAELTAATARRPR